MGGAFLLLYTKQVDVIELLARPVKPYMQGPLIVTHPSDLFDIVMNASIAIGLVVASPVIVWQIWGFLSPALYGHEKKLVIPMLVGAALLFFAGMTLAYVYVLPVTFAFLLGFQSASVKAMLTVHELSGFVISMCLAFGAIFELPIRHAFVGCIIAAALITPGQDPTSLALLTAPLYLLYELSIGLSRLVFSRRERRLAAQDDATA